MQRQELYDQATIANTEVRELKSAINDQLYQVKISFPKSYFSSPTQRFPTLYMLVAETNFRGVSYIM
ncbi:MAG: hypothetical protein MK086_06995 [Flavobacteriales bacterium]|nr:hypothetical protein [Flavobacteriales bacterium]